MSSGRDTFVKYEHPKKAPSPISIMPSPKPISEMLAPKKAFTPIFLTDEYGKSTSPIEGLAKA